jgi:integrase
MSEEHRTAPAPAVKPAAGLTPADTSAASPGKPQKPNPDFPLFPHATRRWAKKIRGQMHYFGPWEDPDGALARYLEQKDDLHAGRKPRPSTDGVTVKGAVNAFLAHKEDKMHAGELSIRTWAKYKEVTDLLINQFGKSRLVADLRPDDFTSLKKTMTKRWGPLRVADFIQHVRSVFKHALDTELIDRPVRFGPGFARPSQKTLRLHRAKQGVKLFTADEIIRMLDALAGNEVVIGPPDEAGKPQTITLAPNPALRAMLLLGINCGFGNADVAGLPLSALDLEAGWINYPRPKTGIARRCPLWPETVEAIGAALAVRPTPKKEEHAGLVFICRRGTPWCSVREKNRTDGVAVQMTKLLKALGINGRKGLGFYTLRHVFRTVADEAKDQPAADHIMGHESPHMSSVYREKISDARLRAVVDHVRAWLFAEACVEQSETQDGEDE